MFNAKWLDYLQLQSDRAQLYEGWMVDGVAERFLNLIKMSNTMHCKYHKITKNMMQLWQRQNDWIILCATESDYYYYDSVFVCVCFRCLWYRLRPHRTAESMGWCYVQTGQKWKRFFAVRNSLYCFRRAHQWHAHTRINRSRFNSFWFKSVEANWIYQSGHKWIEPLYIRYVYVPCIR